MYHPAASSLGKSLEAMQPVLSSDLADYPNELRAALLSRASAGELQGFASQPDDLLCRPVASAVRIASTSGKLQAAANSLIETSGQSPTTFPELAASSLTRYSVSSGDADPKALGKDAYEQCVGDFNDQAAFANFAATGGAESAAAALSGLTELWGLVKPVANGVLGFVDQQRRGRAIVAFIRTDGEKLQTYVKALEQFATTKAAYERAEAAKLFKAALVPASSGTLTDEQREDVLEVAGTYDALRAVDSTSAYVAVGKSIERLKNTASGKFDREDMSAAISGFGESFTTLNTVAQNIAALEKGGTKNEAMKAAIDKIRGKKKPKTAKPEED